MTVSKTKSWDEERTGKIINDLENEKIDDVQAWEKLIALLGSVRAEAIGWTWTQACSQYDRGMDPRNSEIPELLEMANADLNPERK